MAAINGEATLNVFFIAVITGVVFMSVPLSAGIETGKARNKTQIIENIINREAYSLIKKNKGNIDFVILDVRTPEEFLPEHIKNAINLDYFSKSFRTDLDKLDRGKVYLIYCRSARRSGKAMEIMRELDFMEVYNLLGGMIDWKKEGLPLTR
jgi:rhodanese-related sulfurtransferase